MVLQRRSTAFPNFNSLIYTASDDVGCGPVEICREKHNECPHTPHTHTHTHTHTHSGADERRDEGLIARSNNKFPSQESKQLRV